MRQTDEQWMASALTLGRRGMGQVWPNPAVGCILVKNDRVIGRGWTQKGGRPHAEVVALSQAGSDAKGATAYVTLEPCAHFGKSPPCAQALIDAKVAHVVFACGDPDPRVNGRGADMLRAAGISVTQGLLKDQAAQDHQGFFLRTTQNRPMVTLKLASSLDGSIATQSGESQWITGSDARRAVHKMRAQHDAILVGSGTAVADNPDLTVRLAGLEQHSPVRVILDTSAKLSISSQLVASAKVTPVWLCHGPKADTLKLKKLADKGVILIPCDVEDTSVAIKDVMRQLAQKGITRVFSEGGGHVSSSLISSGFVDHLITFHAGLVLGAGSIAGISELPFESLANAPRFKLAEHRLIGQDLMSRWTPI